MEYKIINNHPVYKNEEEKQKAYQEAVNEFAWVMYRIEEDRKKKKKEV